MIIMKLFCMKCGKKYKSHSRHRINPQLNYVGGFADLILTVEDIAKVKGVTHESVEEWREGYPYGILVLSYRKTQATSLIRTHCEGCNGPLKAFAMWVQDEKRTR